MTTVLNINMPDNLNLRNFLCHRKTELTKDSVRTPPWDRTTHRTEAIWKSSLPELVLPGRESLGWPRSLTSLDKRDTSAWLTQVCKTFNTILSKWFRWSDKWHHKAYFVSLHQSLTYFMEGNLQNCECVMIHSMILTNHYLS